MLCSKSVLQPSSALERFGLIRIFPGELDVVAAEVTVGCSLPVDRFAQAQVTDDRTGAQWVVWVKNSNTF